MYIVQVYLDLNKRFTIAQEKEKIKAGYNKLLDLPFKPKSDIIDFQKQRFEEYLQPIYDDIDDYQLKITQHLLTYKEKQTTIKQSDCIEELIELKKNLFINIGQTGDELIETITKLTDDFYEIKKYIDEKAKEFLQKDQGINRLKNRIDILQTKLKTKANRAEKKSKFIYDKISTIRSFLVPNVQLIKLNEENDSQNNEKPLKFGKTIQRKMRLLWVKDKIQQYDTQLEIMNYKVKNKQKSKQKTKIAQKSKEQILTSINY